MGDKRITAGARLLRSAAMTHSPPTPLEESALRAAEQQAALPEEATPRFARELLALVAAHVLAAHARGARVVGIYGAQGSGKTTLAQALAALLTNHTGLRVAALSLDDFYLKKAHRLRVAEHMHPLFATRGVPGTHDVALLQRTLSALLYGDVKGSVPVPRFDKARDDRAPDPELVTAPVDLVLLEGWCLGVPPEPPERLLTAWNAMEESEDVGGRFRRCVNYRLAHDYADLARRVDFLLALVVDSFELSSRQRLEQEHALRARTGEGMSDMEVQAFMQRFERVSRWGIEVMGARADLAIAIDDAHLPRTPVPPPAA